MSLAFGLWRTDGDLAALEWGTMDLESRLEHILAVRTGIDRANLRAVLKGRRKPSPAMLARLRTVTRER